MNNDSFDRLKMDFPIFEIRNNKPYAQHISLANGDSVQANGNATIRVDANKMYQLPDLTAFKMVSPSMRDLINYGVVGNTTTPLAPAPTGVVDESKVEIEDDTKPAGSAKKR